MHQQDDSPVRIPGLYLFAYSIMTGYAQGVQLVKNNVLINSVYGNRRDMVGNTAVLPLNAGDQVWAKVCK